MRITHVPTGKGAKWGFLQMGARDAFVRCQKNCQHENNCTIVYTVCSKSTTRLQNLWNVWHESLKTHCFKVLMYVVCQTEWSRPILLYSPRNYLFQATCFCCECVSPYQLCQLFSITTTTYRLIQHCALLLLTTNWYTSCIKRKRF